MDTFVVTYVSFAYTLHYMCVCLRLRFLFWRSPHPRT